MGRLVQNAFMYFVFLFCMPIKAFIYEVNVLRKWDDGRYHYFIGLSDFHDKEHKANNVQIDQLKEILKHCPYHTIKVLTEDISSPAKNREPICGQFRVRSQGGVLKSLTKTCHTLGLNMHNVEYRYCRVAALGPVLNNLSSNMHNFASVRVTKVANIINEIEDIFKEILSYDACTLLKDFFHRCILNVKKQMHALNLYGNEHMTTVAFLEAYTTIQNRLFFLKKLLTFDSVLLDLRMLHSIINTSNKTTFLGVAGGSHIVRVAKLLEKFGYEKVYNSQPEFTRQYDLERCLGSHIVEKTFCRMPEPVDLRVLADFL